MMLTLTIQIGAYRLATYLFAIIGFNTKTTKTMHVLRNPQYNMKIGNSGWGWGGVGVITCNNVRVNLNTHGLDCMLCTWGWGLGWGNNVQVHVNLNTCTHPSCLALGSFPLHLHTYVMLRSGTFSCIYTHPSCYALGSSLELAHIRHATLWDLLLLLHTYVMLRSGIFSCTCTHTSCYALGSSLALAHIRHATLWDLLLLLHTYVLLACRALSCYIYINIFTLPLVQLSNRCTSTYQTFANHGVLETTNGTNNLLLIKTILKLHTSVSCSCSSDMPHLMHS